MAWRIYRNDFRGMEDAADEFVNAAILLTVNNAVDRAKELVPSLENPGPYATGALQSSIHAVTEEYSDYEEAIAEAKAAPGTRIVKANQIAPPFALPRRTGSVFQAAVVAPLTYAGLIENGFFHVRAGRHIAGQPYFRPAMLEAEKELQALLIRGLKSLQAQKQGRAPRQLSDAELEAIGRADDLAEYRTGNKRAAREATAQRMATLREKLTENHFKRTAFQVKGVNSSGQAVRYWETFGEVAERLRNEFNNLD